jgi:hypothetical protein
MDTSRKAAVTAAVVLAAALAVTGTWAYTSFNQSATNELETTSNPGVRLHDDFYAEGAKDVVVTGTTLTKDVYVENYGQHAQYVRIKLYEYSLRDTTTDYPDTTTADKDHPENWKYVHVADAGGEVANPTGDPGHTWWEWAMGGQKNYKFTANRDDTTADENDSGTDDDPAHDAFAADNDSADPNGVPIYKDEEVNATSDHTIGQIGTTLNAQYVITMKAWLAASDKSIYKDAAWILDEDGWFYWAGPLASGDATGLLLNSITLKDRPEATSFFYGVHVVLEAATSEDVAKFGTDGRTITGNALDLLKFYANHAPVVNVGKANVTVLVETDKDMAYDIAAAGIFSDPDAGDTLTYEVVSEGTSVANTPAPTIADGKVTYTPVADDIDDTPGVILIKAKDELGASSPVVALTLAPAN